MKKFLVYLFVLVSVSTIHALTVGDIVTTPVLAGIDSVSSANQDLQTAFKIRDLQKQVKENWSVALPKFLRLRDSLIKTNEGTDTVLTRKVLNTYEAYLLEKLPVEMELPIKVKIGDDAMLILVKKNMDCALINAGLFEFVKQPKNSCPDK